MLVFARGGAALKRLTSLVHGLQSKFPYATSTSVDVDELTRFRQLSSDESSAWSDEAGPFKALHSFNRLRVPWIVSNLVGEDVENSENPLSGLNVVDIGAGGGILSTALCRLGANVVAVDADENAIRIGKKSAENSLRDDFISRITFKSKTVEELAEESPQAFDAVVASEVLEHVADIEAFVTACAKLGKQSPRTRLFFTTINKTACSRALGIWIAEDVLSIVPKGIHDWEKFVEPGLLKNILADVGYKASPVYGLRYNPLNNSWAWSQFSAVNYALVASRA